MAAVASHIVFALGQKLFHTAVDIEGRIERKRKNFHFHSPLQNYTVAIIFILQHFALKINIFCIKLQKKG
jgi:hypothetical protein